MVKVPSGNYYLLSSSSILASSFSIAFTAESRDFHIEADSLFRFMLALRFQLSTSLANDLLTSPNGHTYLELSWDIFPDNLIIAPFA